MQEEVIIENQADPMDELRSNYTETERVILERRSVRKYKKDQVPEWMIKRILEAGRFAPSAGNCQPWKFVVVREKEIIDEITQDLVKETTKLEKLIDYRHKSGQWLKKKFAKLMIRIMPSKMHPTPFSAIKQIAEGTLDLYHGAPSVIFIFKDKRGISNPDLDGGIAGQNMVLAAHSMGLGTCWVSFTGMLFDKKKWNEFFGIEYPYEFLSSIAVGFPFFNPDGMIERQTHAVDWYEGGSKKTIY